MYSVGGSAVSQRASEREREREREKKRDEASDREGDRDRHTESTTTIRRRHFSRLKSGETACVCVACATLKDLPFERAKIMQLPSIGRRKNYRWRVPRFRYAPACLFSSGRTRAKKQMRRERKRGRKREILTRQVSLSIFIVGLIWMKKKGRREAEYRGFSEFNRAEREGNDVIYCDSESSDWSKCSRSHHVRIFNLHL